MIAEEHIAFAKAVVALARQHNMQNLNITFRLGTGTDPDKTGPVSAAWAQERHGSAGRIALRGEAFASVLEDGEHYPG